MRTERKGYHTRRSWSLLNQFLATYISPVIMGQKVSIAKQPVETQRVRAGESATLGITTKTTPEQYVWEFSPSGAEETWRDVTGERFDGADTAVLRVTDVQISDGGFYRCVVRKKERQAVKSNPSALIVASPPVITSPASEEKCFIPLHGSTTLKVEATGSREPLNYQWEQRNITDEEGACNKFSIVSSGICKDILASVYPTMAENFNVKFAIHYLRQQKLINDDEYERLLLTDKTRRDMVDLLKLWLPEAGEGYLEKLIYCLRKTSEECPVHSSIADEIEAGLEKAASEYVVIPSSSEGWSNLKDGDNFSGCNEECLTVTSACAGNAGIYRCQVSNDAGEVFSPPVHLSVVEAPKIIEDLEGIKVKHRTQTTLKVGGVCDGPMCFEWQRRANDATEWQDVSSEAKYTGQGTPSLTIADVDEEDVGIFRCRISSAGGDTSTKEVPLQICKPPKIVEDLQDIKTKPHSQITLEVAAECEEQMNYLWKTKSANSTEWRELSSGSKYQGQGTPSLVVADVDEKDVGMFHCVVSSDGGDVVTRDTHLKIFDVPKIVEEVSDERVKPHRQVTFKVRAECEEQMNYLWKTKSENSTEWMELSSGSKYQGQGTPSLVVADVDEKDVGMFHCVVSSDGGDIVTRDAHLKIFDVPKIVEDVSDERVKPHSQVTFKVRAECEEQMNYLWKTKSETSTEWMELSSGSKYQGQGTPSLVVADVDEKDVGMFHCVVSSDGGDVVTRDAHLKIFDVPKIVEDVSDERVKPHSQVTFKVRAECEEQMNYLWETKSENSTEWMELSSGSKYQGQGTPSLVVADVDEKDVGMFHCVVSSDGGSVVTREASLRIISAPRITENVADVKVALLAEGVFKVGAECEDSMTYVWQMKRTNSMEWQDVSYESKYKGQGTRTLTIADAEDEDVGTFRCVVSSDGGSIVSRDASLGIAQVARLASSDDHLSYGSLAEITALRNKLMEFKAPIARYQSKVSAENVERQLVKQGSLVKHSRSKEVERHFLLFTDVLIITEKKGSEQFLFKEAMPIHYMQVEEKSEHSDSALWFDVHSVTRSLTLTAKSIKDKLEWMQELKKCIEAYNKKIGRDPLITDCVHLEHAPINELDRNVTKCQLCEKAFTVKFRKHHCRKCGKIVCDRCSRARVKLPRHKKPERVCDKCDPDKFSPTKTHSTTVPIEEPTVLQRPACSVEGLKRGCVRCAKTNSLMWYELDFDGALYIYKAQKDISAERSFPILGYGFIPNRGDLTLRLTHPTGDELFAVDSIEEFDKWLEAIKEILPY